MCFQIKKIHRELNSANEKRSSAMYIIIIFQNTRDKNKILKAIKRKQITKVRNQNGTGLLKSNTESQKKEHLQNSDGKSFVT